MMLLKLERTVEEEFINEELSLLPDDVRDRLKSISSQQGRSSSVGSRESYDRTSSTLNARNLSTISQRRSRVSTAKEDKDAILKQVQAISEKKKLIEEEKAAIGHVSNLYTT